MSPAPKKAPKDSVYKQCATALDRVAEHPPRQYGGVFTEIHVISEAVDKAWSESDYDKAMHDAAEVCGQRYRGGRLCRYGPVKVGEDSEDYARIAGKIVYADARTGPDVWRTPNGDFPKLMFDQDPINHQGRKPSAKRNDAEPWDQQTLMAGKTPPKPDQGETSNDLMSALLELTRRVEHLEEDKRERDAELQRRAERLTTA